jgi:hypothetical protein
MINFLKVLLLIICFLAVERFCHKQTKGFTIAKISSNLPLNPDWEIPPLSEKEQKELEKILDQPFFFLGYGGQSYAFLSKDKTTVIKFFKHHHMRPHPIPKKIPLPSFLDRFLQAQEYKLYQIFGSCKLAYDDFKEEAGLIYLHLNKTQHFNKKIKIVDNLGIAHFLDIDSMTFVIQKKAELFFEKIKGHAQAKDAQGMKNAINSLIDLILARCQKGIKDIDTGLKRNFGFIGNAAAAIDIGSFIKDDTLKDPSNYKKELIAKTKRLNHWLNKHCPEYEHYYHERLQTISASAPTGK